LRFDSDSPSWKPGELRTDTRPVKRVIDIYNPYYYNLLGEAHLLLKAKEVPNGLIVAESTAGDRRAVTFLPGF
jgi:hypothetical protein